MPTTVTQNPLTVIAAIRPGMQASLNDKMTELGADPGGNAEMPLSKISTLHFSALVILEEESPYPPYLVLECNFDGSPKEFWDRLIEVASAGLTNLFAHCVDFPESPTPDQLRAYLEAHSADSAAFYVGCRGQSVELIRNAMTVREEIENFLDQENEGNALEGLSAQSILERIQAHLDKPGVESPVLSSETLEELKKRSNRNILLLILFGIPILLLTWPLILIWLVFFRLREAIDNWKEKHHPLPPLPIDPRLLEDPDIYSQSHLTTMVSVNAGPVRAFTLKGILAITSLLAKTVSIFGNLLGIPTIHFARWVYTDDSKRLLFFSNYDGSWASYLGDFVDKAKYGLTAIWGNTDRFPPSKWLVLGGAAYIVPFKEWSREHNVYAPFFYKAYPSATIANLLNDIEIRDNVGRPMSESEAQTFLRRF